MIVRFVPSAADGWGLPASSLTFPAKTGGRLSVRVPRTRWDVRSVPIVLQKSQFDG